MNFAFLINFAGQLITLFTIGGILWALLRYTYNPRSAALQEEIARGTALYLRQLGTQCERDGRGEEALSLFQGAARLSEAAGDWSGQAAALQAQASMYLAQGEAARENDQGELALTLFGKAFDVYMAANDKEGQIAALRATVPLNKATMVDNELAKHKAELDQIDQRYKALGGKGDIDWKAAIGAQYEIVSEDVLQEAAHRIQREPSPRRRRLLTILLYVFAGLAEVYQVWMIFRSAGVVGH